MPNWKKVVVSGSAAILSSVTSSFTGSLTGALIGTASWAASASNAVSASWAPGGTTFPYIGNAVITGSLIVSGSGGTNTSLNTTTGILKDPAGIDSINWNARLLYDPTGNANTVDYGNGVLYDLSGIDSVAWVNRALYDSPGNPSIDWENRLLNEPTNTYVAFEYSNDTYTQTQLYHQQSIASNTVVKALSNTALQWSGQSLSGTITGSSSAGDVVYLDADNIWKQVNSATSTSEKMLGINIDGTNVLIEGDITMTDTMISGPGYGFPIYLKDISQLSTTTPSSGYIRVVGHCYGRSSVTTTNWVVKFRPSNDWYKI